MDARKLIEAVYTDGVATINERDYTFTTTIHKTRLKVFAYLTKIKSDLEAQNFGFMSSKEWEDIEATIGRIVTIDDMQLAKLPKHWDKHPEDYLQLMTIALQVISYPFMKGNPTG